MTFSAWVLTICTVSFYKMLQTMNTVTEKFTYVKYFMDISWINYFMDV